MKPTLKPGGKTLSARVWRWLKIAVAVIAVSYLLFGLAVGIWLGYGLYEGLRQIPD